MNQIASFPRFRGPPWPRLTNYWNK